MCSGCRSFVEAKHAEAARPHTTSPRHFKRHMAGFARDPFEPRAQDRQQDRNRRPQRNVYIHRERCPRSSSARRRTSRGAPGESASHRARHCPLYATQGLGVASFRALLLAQKSARSGLRRYRVRDCIARRTSIATPRQDPNGRRATGTTPRSDRPGRANAVKSAELVMLKAITS
jgi:hypothetical protein